MKRSLILAFLLMGFTFTVAQSLLIRELLVSFFGNELSIGLILGNWLILEALGSGYLERAVRWVWRRLRGREWQPRAPSYAALQVIFSLALPVSVYAAFVARRLVGATPGLGVGLWPILWASFLILAPLGLVDLGTGDIGPLIVRMLENQLVEPP